MGVQNGTPSKESTEEKEYTFYCEERLVRVLFFCFTIVKRDGIYQIPKRGMWSINSVTIRY